MTRSATLAEIARQTRDAVENAVVLARLGRDLPGYLRAPLRLDEARRHVRWGLEHREDRLVDLVDRAVYAHVASPYRRLLANAGCEPGDFRALVLREGVDGALGHLAGRGVYVTFEELKGRRPAIRGSAQFTFQEHEFDNPLGSGAHFLTFTGGSGGRSSCIRRTLTSVTDTAAPFLLALDAHGIERWRTLLWIGGSIAWPLIHLKLGQPVDAWLSPSMSGTRLVRAAVGYVATLARLAGHRLPLPEYCDLRDPEQVVAWLSSRLQPEMPIVVNTRASSAVRVAVAAADVGRSLPGVLFHCRSEPLSPARRRLIEAVGARAFTDYASMELPQIAFACPDGIAPDDAHLCMDSVAAIVRERRIFDDGPTVDTLMLTTLTTTGPRVALNAELGDSAQIEDRDCGCSLGALGLRTHLSEIRSFEKLSSEGTTFARSNVTKILEEVLPGRFGGTALDYQLVEEETQDAATALTLRISPSVGPLDEREVRTALLMEMGRGGFVDAYQSRLIRQAESVVVQRKVPLATRAGKVLPYQLRRYAESEPVRA